MGMENDNRDSLPPSGQSTAVPEAQPEVQPRVPDGYSMEVVPVGLRSPAGSSEEPEFYKVNAGADGKSLTVGPYDLTAQQIKDWTKQTTADQLDELIQYRQIRPSTALAVRSGQFQHVLQLLEEGRKPTPEMIERFIPGDLQRVVALEMRKG